MSALVWAPLRAGYGLGDPGQQGCWIGLAAKAAGQLVPAQVAIAICRRERPDVVLARISASTPRAGHGSWCPATGLPLIVHFRGAMLLKPLPASG